MIEQYEKDGKKIVELSDEYGVSPPAVKKILDKSSDYKEFSTMILNHRMKHTPFKVKEHDNQMVAFIQRARNFNVPLSRKFLLQKAQETASSLDCKTCCTSGWFQKFLKRNFGKNIKLNGEAKSADDNIIKEWLIENGPTLLMYKPENIWNCDESGLQWKRLNNRTYVIGQNENKENEHGVTLDKKRMTLLLCCSLTGDKRKIFVIGHADRPRCFKSINFDHKRLPVDYRSNQSAWMTGNLFNEWLSNWNRELIDQNKKILLIMDNFSGHKKYTEKNSNIEILLLPPNTTSKLQPLDAGIIKAFKDKYSFLFHSYLLESLSQDNYDLKTELKKYSLLDAIKLVSKAWDSLEKETIINCWSHTGIADVFNNVENIITDDHSYCN